MIRMFTQNDRVIWPKFNLMPCQYCPCDCDYENPELWGKSYFPSPVHWAMCVAPAGQDVNKITLNIDGEEKKLYLRLRSAMPSVPNNGWYNPKSDLNPMHEYYNELAHEYNQLLRAQEEGDDSRETKDRIDELIPLLEEARPKYIYHTLEDVDPQHDQCKGDYSCCSIFYTADQEMSVDIALWLHGRPTHMTLSRKDYKLDPNTHKMYYERHRLFRNCLSITFRYKKWDREEEKIGPEEEPRLSHPRTMLFVNYTEVPAMLAGVDTPVAFGHPWPFPIGDFSFREWRPGALMVEAFEKSTDPDKWHEQLDIDFPPAIDGDKYVGPGEEFWPHNFYCLPTKKPWGPIVVLFAVEEAHSWPWPNTGSFKGMGEWTTKSPYGYFIYPKTDQLPPECNPPAGIFPPPFEPFPELPEHDIPIVNPNPDPDNPHIKPDPDNPKPPKPTPDNPDPGGDIPPEPGPGPQPKPPPKPKPKPPPPGPNPPPDPPPIIIVPPEPKPPKEFKPPEKITLKVFHRICDHSIMLPPTYDISECDRFHDEQIEQFVYEFESGHCDSSSKGETPDGHRVHYYHGDWTYKLYDKDGIMLSDMSVYQFNHEAAMNVFWKVRDGRIHTFDQQLQDQLNAGCSNYPFFSALGEPRDLTGTLFWSGDKVCYAYTEI